METSVVNILVALIPLVVIGGIFALLSYLGFRQERLDREQGIVAEKHVVDTAALADAELQAALARDNKIAAIKRYRELTSAGLKEAKDAVELAIAQPETITKKKRVTPDLAGDGIRDMLAEGRFDEAVEVYRQFAGVDEYTAREAVQRMQADSQM